MVIGILQPGYLPWLGFFEQMMRSEVFVILDDVQYDKHGWRNRNRIKGPRGPVWLSVPVLTKGQHKPLVKEVRIDPHQPGWPKKHLGTIRQHYSGAAYFDEYFPHLERILTNSWEYLIDLDMALLHLMAGWFGLDPKIVFSSRLNIKEENPNERLIEIIGSLGGKVFYEGAAGRDYIDLSPFDRAGLTVVFQDYKPMPYPQQYDGFHPFLSALDLLFNCGPDSSRFLPGLSVPKLTLT